jgi:hypothetical protein
VHHHTTKIIYEETKYDEEGKQDENIITTEITTDEEAISLTKEVNRTLSNDWKKFRRNLSRIKRGTTKTATIVAIIPRRRSSKEQEKQLFLKLEVKWNMDRLSIIKSKLLLFTKQSTAANALTTNESNNNGYDRFKKNTEPLLVGEEPLRIVTSSKQDPYIDSHPESRCFKNKLIVMEDDP